MSSSLPVQLEAPQELGSKTLSLSSWHFINAFIIHPEQASPELVLQSFKTAHGLKKPSIPRGAYVRSDRPSNLRNLDGLPHVVRQDVPQKM